MSDLGCDLRRVNERVSEGRTQKLSHAIRGEKQRPEPLRKAFDSPRGIERVETRRAPLSIVHRQRVEGEDSTPRWAALFPVEALPGFFSNPSACDQLADQRGQPERRPFVGPVQTLRQVGGDIGQNVEPGDIHRSARRAFWPTDDWTAHRIDLFHGEGSVGKETKRPSNAV